MTMPFSLSELIATATTDSEQRQDTPQLAKFRDMARRLMAEHGVSDWAFQFDSARKRAGHCTFGRNGMPGTLSFSPGLMSRWTEAQQRQIVLHEIAHAQAGPYHGHDETWQLTCMRIGAKPDRLWGGDGEERLPSRWTGTCPNGHVIRRERRSRNPQSCGACSKRFDERYLITWTENPDYY